MRPPEPFVARAATPADAAAVAELVNAFDQAFVEIPDTADAAEVASWWKERGALVESRGFEPVRHFYRMLVDLDGPPPEPEWPEGFRFSPFRPGEDERVLHAVIGESFADHWGFVLDQAVAAEVNAFRFGFGWVNVLGTLAPWRGRGLGRALLLTAFGEFHRRGQSRVALGVNAGNETGATQLYESVGMRVAWQADVYEKRV